jgi:hypothetical protein
MTHATDQAAFRFSRIFAEGWKAARTMPKTGTGAANVSDLNPYRSEPERVRWNEGFAKALE